MLGDTDENNFYLHDEEIVAMLEISDNNINKAALESCESILAKLAKDVDYSIGPEKVSASQAFEHYTKVLSKIKLKAKKFGSPSSSIRPSNFTLGMHDNA